MQINEIREDSMVTVVCITYNHHDYIREALDSFLMQKTTFPFQIFVGEDRGPDDTAEIVKEYAQKYPDKIVAFLREENMGAQRNLINMCQQAKSPYIAFCEGDDFWIDEYKLQKQFDFMESHPDVRICGGHTRIQASENWFLKDRFHGSDDSSMIYPECDPGCPLKRSSDVVFFDMRQAIAMSICHTSTMFFRWDYTIEIPDWYFEGIVGDLTIFLIQLKDGKAALLPDVISCYRPSDVGVYMSKSMDEHFLKTRVDWIRITTGMLEYYDENEIPGYPWQALIERRRLELTNFINTCVKCNCLEKIGDIIEQYPQACREMFGLYVSYYHVNRNMIRRYSWEGKQLLTSNRYFMHLMGPFMKGCGWLYKRYRGIKQAIKKTIVYLAQFVCYWVFTLVPKRKDLWVFSGFMKKNYMDNSKYFFEYINEHHPEIRSVWVTKNDKVLEELREKGLTGYRMNSLKGIWNTARASVAVTDHFVMSDYSKIYGFNNQTKVLNLWHGVGFKSMGDGVEVKNTTVPGVVYSSDILPKPTDNFFVRLWKGVKYFFLAPTRELFEKYFMLVCPGQERVDMIGKCWHMKDDAFFMAGHPRNSKVYEQLGKQEKHNRILYAPTYRFDAGKEREMIEKCLDACEQVQAYMEEIDGEFYLRLHPHTWRNYESMILEKIRDFDRIFLDETPDIYDSIAGYSFVITDYSSISLDCALFGIPGIFLCEDYDWFIKHEAGFGVDYLHMTPGPKAYNWKEVLEYLRLYVNDPDYMLEERKMILSYYFDETANGIDNSERIIVECKRRLAEK
jgi:CDP-glycerol glycerophosphotransferase (TagB/SpsB family)